MENEKELRKFLAEHEHDYFFSKCDKENSIENLSKLPYFDEVYKYYKEFADNNKIAYLDEATEYIMEKLELNLSETEKDNLKTYAYYCSHYLGNIKENEKIKKFNDEGFYNIKSDEKLEWKKD